MLTYLRLSGEHRTLPLAEVRAVLEAEDIVYKELINIDQLVVLEIPKHGIKSLTNRLSLTISLGEVIGIYDRGVGIKDIVRDLKDNLASDKVMVVYDRVKGRQAFSYEELLNALRSSNIICSVKDYEEVIEVIISDLVVVGRRLYRRRLQSFFDRMPQKRPVYRPGTLTPQVSRLFVNLSRASSSNSPYLDPFCGVGGFLIEACLMGVGNYLGVEINEDYARGARINLLHYGCIPNVVVGDACSVPINKVGAIGTDPPYGRMTKSVSRELKDLMMCFLEEASKVLRKGSYLVFAQRKGVISDEDIVSISGLELIEKHLNWVHGSLTRDIYVVRRV